MKRCTKCKKLKPLAEFHKRNDVIDGYRSHCRECHSDRMEVWRAKNQKRIKERRRIYYTENLAAIAEQKQIYRVTHKAAVAKRLRVWRRTMFGFASKIWYSLNSRTVNGKHPNTRHNACYFTKVMADGRIGVHLDLTKDELLALVNKNWRKIKRFWASGKTPSIDRINPDGHYSVGNVRFIALLENCRRARRKRKASKVTA